MFSISISDIAFVARRPVNWAAIPADPQRLLASAASVVPAESDLSLFQARLPRALAERERVQPWVKDPAVGDALARIAGSEPRAVPASTLEGFALPVP